MPSGCWTQRQSILAANCEPPKASHQSNPAEAKPRRGTFLKWIKLEKRTSPGWVWIKTLSYKWAAEEMIHVRGCHYLLIDICICSWNLHLHWSPDSTNIVFFTLTFVSRFKLLYVNEPLQRFTHLLLMQLSCQNKVLILISFQIVEEIRFALLVSPIGDFKTKFHFQNCSIVNHLSHLIHNLKRVHIYRENTLISV